MPSGDFEGFSECASLGVADGASPRHRAGTLSLMGRRLCYLLTTPQEEG